MAENEMTKRDLERVAEIPYHRLNAWFRRPTAKANGEDLAKLCDVFKTTPDYLLKGIGAPHIRDDLADQLQRLSPEEKQEVHDFVDFLLSRKRNTEE